MATHDSDDVLADAAPETLDRLRAELSPGTTGDGDGAPDSVQTADALLREVVEGFTTGESFSFEEETVKENLGEILLTLVAGRSTESNGKRLMEDLGRVFDADLSPGTVYPQLHDFEEAGLLERHELVRTKEYHLDDEDACRERIADQMRQHIVLGLFYHRALAEL
jgi:hypothetical protein